MRQATDDGFEGKRRIRLKLLPRSGLVQNITLRRLAATPFSLSTLSKDRESTEHHFHTQRRQMLQTKCNIYLLKENAIHVHKSDVMNTTPTGHCID